MVGLPCDAGKRCNSDSTSKEYGRFSGILMQREGAHCRVHLHDRAERHFLQRALKCRVTHAGCEHELVFKWSAGNGKGADVSFGIGFWRIQQRQIGGLSGLEIKSRRSFKVEGHSAFRNFNSIQQSGWVCRYGNFFSRHDEVYGWYPPFCHWANSASWSSVQYGPPGGNHDARNGFAAIVQRKSRKTWLK